MMVGKSAEKQYQLSAQKRSEATLKFDYYKQAARYFERECGKAKQFNSWNIEPLRPSHWENIRRLEALKLRRNRLEQLLKREEEQYRQEFELGKSRKFARDNIPLEDLKNRLKEKRSELSLYNPRVSRRIQSYLSYPSQASRSVLRELNSPKIPNSVRMSLNSDTENDQFDKHEVKVSTVDVDDADGQVAFNGRAQEFKENRFNAMHSHFENSSGKSDMFVKHATNAESTRSANDPVDHDGSHFFGINSSPKRDNSNVKQDILGHNPFRNKTPNKKFEERYSHGSLENTNVGQPVGNLYDYSNDILEKQNTEAEEIDDENHYSSESHAKKTYRHSIDAVDYHRNIHHQEDNIRTLIDPMDSVHLDEEQCDIPGEILPKLVEEVMNKLPLTVDDKNRSNLMFVYLTHNEIMRKIGDLEVREHRAVMKHLWEEALRLREMKNTLNLLREKQIFQLHDPLINPERKELAMNHIEARSQQLDNRKKLKDSWMFSEEAKYIWDKWIDEDNKSHIADISDCSQALLEQLEKEWTSMAEAEKQKITTTYRRVMTESSAQLEMQHFADNPPRK